MRKKLLSLIAAAAVTLSVIGCGSSGAASSSASSAASTPAAAATTAETPADAAATSAAEAVTAATEAAVPAADGTYKIGVLFPQSGDLAFFTAYFAPALDIYVNDLNAAGGINGHQVELVYKDSQGDPSITAQRLDEFKGEEVSAIIGPFFDTGGPVAAQWAETNKIPVIMCCALATDVGMKNTSRYVFTAGSSAWAWAKIFADGCKEKGYKSAYYIGNDGGVPDDVYNFFWDEVKKQGLDIKDAGSTRLSGSETDLSSVITSIIAADPDVIITSLTNTGAVNLIKQGNQFGLFDSSDLFGVYIAGADHTETIGSDYAVGKIWAIDWFPINFKETQDYAKQVQEKADGVIPNGATATYLYAADTVCTALAGMDYEDRLDSDKVVEALENVKCDSLIEGSQIYYTSYSHQLVFPMYFAGTKFDDNWGGIALPDESDSKLYGEEAFPTQEEWDNKAKELGLKTLDDLK